jgi:hypothetical protein
MTLRDLTVLTIKISGVVLFVLFVLLVARLPEYLKAYLAIRGQSPLLGRPLLFGSKEGYQLELFFKGL